MKHTYATPVRFQTGPADLNSEIRNPKSAIRDGFTIPELLVVISIMILLFTVGLPNLNSLFKAARGESGPQTLTAATATARAYATRNPFFNRGDYEGTALIVTPANELRIVEHIPLAIGPSSGNPAVGDSASLYSIGGANGGLLTPMGNAGYADIAGLDYIQLPEDTGIVGVVRDDKGMRLLAPPFAIRYNRMGNLVSRTEEGGSTVTAEFVYYDGNYSGLWGDSNPRDRVASYDPLKYDPFLNSPPRNNTNYSIARARYILPFEQIETVIGVIFFSRNELQGLAGQAGYPKGDDTESMLKANSKRLNNRVTEWIMHNGKLVMFNRYTGSSLAK